MIPNLSETRSRKSGGTHGRIASHVAAKTSIIPSGLIIDSRHREAYKEISFEPLTLKVLPKLTY